MSGVAQKVPTLLILGFLAVIERSPDKLEAGTVMDGKHMILAWPHDKQAKGWFFIANTVLNIYTIKTNDLVQQQ